MGYENILILPEAIGAFSPFTLKNQEVQNAVYKDMTDLQWIMKKQL